MPSTFKPASVKGQKTCIAHETLIQLINSKFETLSETVNHKMTGMKAEQMEGIDAILMGIQEIKQKQDFANGKVGKHTEQIEQMFVKIQENEIDLRFMKWVRKNWYWTVVISFCMIGAVDWMYDNIGWDVVLRYIR
jgi:putative protein kinase ArgK-like GTPase of G3E family